MFYDNMTYVGAYYLLTHVCVEVVACQFGTPQIHTFFFLLLVFTLESD